MFRSIGQAGRIPTRLPHLFYTAFVKCYGIPFIVRYLIFDTQRSEVLPNFKQAGFYCAHDQKPQTQPKRCNEAKRIADIRDSRETWEKEELERSYQPGTTMDHQHDAQKTWEENQLENHISQREKPGTIKYLGDHKPIFVEIQ